MKKTRLAIPGLLALLGLFLLVACSKKESSESQPASAPAASSAPAATPIDPATVGSVSGSVKYDGTAPKRQKIDMSQDPACKGPNEAESIVADKGGLANVFVYVKDGLGSRTFDVPKEPVVLDQTGCRYHPHVLGVLVGQQLAIKNSDGILHNIKAKGTKNRPFNISQPTVMTSERTFTAPEVMVPLECNVHGWMHAWLAVLPHPFFAVSGTDGTFSIKGLPPGTYTIEAWHEKYGTQTATVTVAGSETKTADFTFVAK